MAAASPAAAEHIGGGSKVEIKIVKENETTERVLQNVPDHVSFESGVKPVMSLMEFDTSEKPMLPTFPVCIPVAFEATSSCADSLPTSAKSLSEVATQQENISSRKPSKLTTFTTHKEEVNKKLASSKSLNKQDAKQEIKKESKSLVKQDAKQEVKKESKSPVKQENKKDKKQQVKLETKKEETLESSKPSPAKVKLETKKEETLQSSKPSPAKVKLETKKEETLESSKPSPARPQRKREEKPVEDNNLNGKQDEIKRTPSPYKIRRDPEYPVKPSPATPSGASKDNQETISTSIAPSTRIRSSPIAIETKIKASHITNDTFSSDVVDKTPDKSTNVKDKLNISTQTPTPVIPGVSPKGSPNKPSPKPILKIPKTSTAKISFIQLDPQDPASPTPQNPIPDTEMIVSYKHNDFKENFVEAVKVDVVNMHFKEKDSKKELVEHDVTEAILQQASVVVVQQKKKTMSVSFQDPPHESLSSPEEVPSPEPTSPGPEKVQMASEHLGNPKQTLTKPKEDINEIGSCDIELSFILESALNSSTTVPDCKRGVESPFQTVEGNQRANASPQVSSTASLKTPKTPKSSKDNPTKSLARSPSFRSVVTTPTQQQFQAPIYNAPEVVESPKVAGARSKKPTLAAQFRKQKERQKQLAKQKTERLESFYHWPGYKDDNIPKAEILAEAGFYFTGLNDCVQCLSCDVALSGWEAGEDPWIRHCQNSPGCSHLLEIKGPEWVYDNYKAEE